MIPGFTTKDAVLLYAVVDDNMSGKVIQYAKRHGITSATVMRGRGTITSKWLNAIGIMDSRKEIVMMGAERETALCALEALSDHFHFEKPQKGIVFALKMPGFYGSDAALKCHGVDLDTVDGEAPLWQLITVIVDRGKADDVVDTAQRAGCFGGTIITGRGSGISQTKTLLNMEIEPEKEIVFMLTSARTAPDIEEAIDRELELDKPNHGIMFTQDVLKVRGLYQAD